MTDKRDREIHDISEEMVPISHSGVMFHKSISLGNLVAIVIFVVGLAMQWAIMSKVIDQHEIRIIALENQVDDNERELIKRSAIQDRNVEDVRIIMEKLNAIDAFIREHISEDRKHK